MYGVLVEARTFSYVVCMCVRAHAHFNHPLANWANRFALCVFHSHWRTESFLSTFVWSWSVSFVFCVRCALIVSIDLLVTWLILPVVICLSQRLRHACLSINIFIPWNCVQLIISVIIYLMVPYYMDTRSNSRANTCVKSRLSGRDVFIR
jgi:hypothetical protein